MVVCPSEAEAPARPAAPHFSCVGGNRDGKRSCSVRVETSLLIRALRGLWMFKSSWSRVLVAGTGLMTGAAILLSGCSSTGAPQASGGKKGQKGGMALSVSVAIAKAETRDLPVYLSV